MTSSAQLSWNIGMTFSNLQMCYSTIFLFFKVSKCELGTRTVWWSHTTIQSESLASSISCWMRWMTDFLDMFQELVVKSSTIALRFLKQCWLRPPTFFLTRLVDGNPNHWNWDLFSFNRPYSVHSKLGCQVGWWILMFDWWNGRGLRKEGRSNSCL